MYQIEKRSRGESTHLIIDYWILDFWIKKMSDWWSLGLKIEIKNEADQKFWCWATKLAWKTFWLRSSESHPKLLEANRIFPLISVGFKSCVWSWGSQTTDEKKMKIGYLELWPTQDCTVKYSMQASWCQLGHLNSSEKHIGVSRPVRIWKRLFLLCLRCSYSLKSRVTAAFSVVFQYFSVLFKELSSIEQVISSLCRWKIKD